MIGQIELICSNKPRPSVQKGPKGSQHWRRDVHHARHPGRSFTLCYQETTGWLVIDSAFRADDPNLCKHCARVIARSLPPTTTILGPQPGGAVPGNLGCRRCGGWGYIRHIVPAACPTCDLCNGSGIDPEQPGGAVAGTERYDPAFAEEINRADASPPEAEFGNVEGLLEHLNGPAVTRPDREIPSDG